MYGAFFDLFGHISDGFGLMQLPFHTNALLASLEKHSVPNPKVNGINTAHLELVFELCGLLPFYYQFPILKSLS